MTDEARPKALLAGAIAIQRRGVERPDPDPPCVIDDGDGVVVGHGREQASNRSCSKSEARDPQARAAEWYAFERFVRHPFAPRLAGRCPRETIDVAGQPIVSFSPSSTGQHTEQNEGIALSGPVPCA